jgi:hypothetical protein
LDRRLTPSPCSGIHRDLLRGKRRIHKAPSSNPCLGMPGWREIRSNCVSGVVFHRPGDEGQDRFRRMAWQHTAVGCDVQRSASPAAETGLGTPHIIVRDNHVDCHTSPGAWADSVYLPHRLGPPARAPASASSDCTKPSRDIARARSQRGGAEIHCQVAM